MRILVTGSGGLIGSEACKFFLQRGEQVIGIDNNMRRYFFGDGGDTRGNIDNLKSLDKQFTNYNIDIRDRQELQALFQKLAPFDLIIHTAAQPSHDWAKKEPFTDFDINASGTLNMLENFRLYSSGSVFIFTSTNKVYGDNPNKVNIEEKELRWDYSPSQIMRGISQNGISEKMSIDNCIHSLFGVSKVAADTMAQEYGRYFGLKIGIFRGGCLTGSQHAAVELHGFLAYIVRCAVKNIPYTVFGYKAKQVRDQIHSSDVMNAFWEFHKNPKKGEAYNLGGCKENSASILEIIKILQEDFNLSLNYNYDPINRIGDHICYYSDMGKFKKDYPNWKIQKSLKQIIEEMVRAYSFS